MSNSFYYFFSATPQVLAAILALFGVFIIFKIQAIKSELIGIGQIILEKTNYLYLKVIVYKRDNDLIDLSTEILRLLKQFVMRNNIEGIKSTISLMTNEVYTKDDEMYLNLGNYNRIYKNFKFLVNSTITWSIFTATLIIVCLTILSQGDYFLNHSCFLSFAFWGIIGLIFICFSGLIYILIKSLKES